MRVFRRASVMEHVGKFLTDAFLRKPQPERERSAISCSQEYCTEGGMAQFIGFSLFMAWKKEKAWILRLMFPVFQRVY